MTLCDPIGSWFSELTDNWEEQEFYYDSLVYGDVVKDDTRIHYCSKYRRYGDLPNGSHFGVWLFPSMTSFADFKDPPFTGIIIVDESGYMQASNPAEHMHLQPEEHYYPMSIAFSPTGKSLVWITEGELWIWQTDCREERFITDDGKPDSRFEGRKIRDARMQDDGILEILLEDGETLGIFCDENMLLKPFEGGWIPGDEAAAWGIGQPMSCWPESLVLMVRKEDTGWQTNNLNSTYYNNCEVRRVCFEPGLETIKSGILAMNPKLESVVIPDYVRQVETFAFGCCDNLKNLVIEGDLSRVTNWAEDVFDGCPCEKYYKQLRKDYTTS